MRLAFMGTPEFAVPTLEALLEGGHEVVAVYTQPPRPAGRGKKDRKSAVHETADKAGLPVFTPESMKSADAAEAFEALDLDCAVVVAYGQILPQRILDAPRFGCINVHASLLPRWRGAAPIHRAIMAGDTETGICIMQMEAGLDTGPVISRAVTPIAPEDTTLSLHDRLSDLGASLVNDALQSLWNRTAQPVVQAEDGITYARKIEKAEAHIDWTVPAEIVDRKVRGLFPFPGAWTDIMGERVKVLGGRVTEESATAGVTLDEALTVGCGVGAYQILRAQRSGKGPVDSRDMLRGFPVPKGTRLE